MLRDLTLRLVYEAPKEDIGAELYSPLFSNCVSMDRATCYFSSKALSKYSEGLEKFARQGERYRLIVSKELSEEDYNSALEGYEMRKGLTDELVANLRENMTLDQKMKLANLSHLIATGVLDMKMAFVKEGLFHPKFGIATDLDGNKILFNGSPNDTRAAIENNYEVVELSKSWSSTESQEKISRFESIFEKLWENRDDFAIVRPLNEVVLKEIGRHDRGGTYSFIEEFVEDCLFLELPEEGPLLLKIKLSDPPSKYSLKHMSKISRFINKDMDNPKEIQFRPDLTYVDIKEIRNRLNRYSGSKGYRIIIGDRVETLIRERDILMEQRSKMGADIKHQDERLMPSLEKYRQAVDSVMVRHLREKQMWDSFFMYTMKRCGNFSVPGAGKTASVLGVFAYLWKECPKTKMVVVGPLSSFKSWVDEFKNCFGGNIELKLFNAQDCKGDPAKVFYNTVNTNMLLFNYEGLGKYVDTLRRIIDKDVILVFDEVHRVKNPQGVYAKFALDLSQDVHRIVILTGTPIPNSYRDLYNPLKFMFSVECEEYFGYYMQRLSNLSPSEMEKMNEAVQPFFCRTTKSVLGVPPPNKDMMISVKASEEENRLLERVKSRYIHDPLALIVRTLQLESDPRMLLDKLDDDEFADVFGDWDADYTKMNGLDVDKAMEEDTDSISSIGFTTKTKHCIDYIRTLTDKGKNVIVWCIFKRSMANIEELLRQSGIIVYSIHGGIGQKEREQTIEDFKRSSSAVLVTNPHTLAESVSLHATCHDAVYFEYSYNLVHLLQSKDRIHRLGLPDDQYTQYHYLQSVFEGDISLDGAIRDRLADKEQMMLDAIDTDRLENITSSREDIDKILHSLGWNNTS